MDNHFEKNALSWGEGGADWLKRIPDMIIKYENRWSFKAEAPFELNYNYVAPAKRSDDTSVVLKIGYPEDREFQSEIAALHAFNGVGICRLLESDPASAVMLLERVNPGTPAAEIEDESYRQKRGAF